MIAVFRVVSNYFAVNAHVQQNFAHSLRQVVGRASAALREDVCT